MNLIKSNIKNDKYFNQKIFLTASNSNVSTSYFVLLIINILIIYYNNSVFYVVTSFVNSSTLLKIVGDKTLSNEYNSLISFYNGVPVKINLCFVFSDYTVLVIIVS